MKTQAVEVKVKKKFFIVNRIKFLNFEIQRYGKQNIFKNARQTNGLLYNKAESFLLSFSPSGGCSMPPFFSQFPMGWISEESTRRQKSFLLSLPSSRRRRREPVRPTTVAMQVDVVFLGSWASNFMPALNSFTGGAVPWKYKFAISYGIYKQFIIMMCSTFACVDEKTHLSEAVRRSSDCSFLF